MIPVVSGARVLEHRTNCGILSVCASYAQSIADKTIGMMENLVRYHVESSTLQLFSYVAWFFSFPFFPAASPSLPCPLFVTFHTFKNLVTHSKPWEKKKAKYRLKSQ